MNSRPANAIHKIARLFAVCAPLALAAHAHAAQNQADKSFDPNTFEVIHSLKAGAFGSVTEEQIAEAQSGQLIPILEERFAQNQDAETKAAIAVYLVRLGDKDDIYWDFLVERATPAVESDAPSPRVLGSPERSPSGHSPEYVAWAKSHNVSPNSPAEEALYGLWGKLQSLARADDPRGIPLLRKALQSPNYEIVAVAAEGLAEVHDKDSIPLIIEACGKAPADVAPMIAQSLELVDDPRAQSAAERCLPKPPDPIKALKESESPGVYAEQIVEAEAVQAIPVLEEKFLDTQQPLDKAHIASALIRLGDKNDIYWDYLVNQAAQAVENDTPNFMSYDSQGKSVGGPSPEFVEWAKARNFSTVELGEQYVSLLQGVVAMLALTGDPRAIPVLRRGLLSRNEMIEVFASKGLAEIGDKDSIPFIIEACRKAPAEIASAIAESLVYFDDHAAQLAVDQYIPKDIAKIYRDGRAQGRKPFCN